MYLLRLKRSIHRLGRNHRLRRSRSTDMVDLLLQWPLKTVTHLFYRCNRFQVATNTKSSATYILNRRVVILGGSFYVANGPAGQSSTRENASEHTFVFEPKKTLFYSSQEVRQLYSARQGPLTTEPN